MTSATRKKLKISAARLAANKANSARSTGPRTEAGKSISSKNAAQHGLAVSTPIVPEAMPKIRHLATIICGEHASASEYEQAITIAQCQMILHNVQAARLTIMKRAEENALVDSRLLPPPGDNHGDSDTSPMGLGKEHAEWDAEIEAMRVALPLLVKLTRYEKRAHSQRWRAIRTFSSLRIRNQSLQA